MIRGPETGADGAVSPAILAPAIGRAYYGEVWTLEVHTRDPAFCGYRFKEGQEYLVYAEGGPGYPADRLVVKNCGRTRLLSKAGAELEVLGDGAAVWDDGGAVLSDTSGGFPPLGVIGMLGGAVAAVSLAVLMRLLRTS